MLARVFDLTGSMEKYSSHLIGNDPERPDQVHRFIRAELKGEGYIVVAHWAEGGELQLVPGVRDVCQSNADETLPLPLTERIVVLWPFFVEGQSYWHYLVYKDPAHEESPQRRWLTTNDGTCHRNRFTRWSG